MINLIPIEEKRKIVLSFYSRLIIVLFFMLGLGVIVASFAILPSFFISYVKKDIANDKLNSQLKEVIPKLDEETISVLNSLNSKLDLIEKNKENKYIVSQKVIKEIVSRKMPGIKINRIFYETDSINGGKVNINGVALSREQLLLFRQSFEDYAIFKKVDLPISNFVKGSNLQFNLNLIPS